MKILKIFTNEKYGNTILFVFSFLISVVITALIINHIDYKFKTNKEHIYQYINNDFYNLNYSFRKYEEVVRENPFDRDYDNTFKNVVAAGLLNDIPEPDIGSYTLTYKGNDTYYLIYSFEDKKREICNGINKSSFEKNGFTDIRYLKTPPILELEIDDKNLNKVCFEEKYKSNKYQYFHKVVLLKDLH